MAKSTSTRSEQGSTFRRDRRAGATEPIMPPIADLPSPLMGIYRRFASVSQPAFGGTPRCLGPLSLWGARASPNSGTVWPRSRVAIMQKGSARDGVGAPGAGRPTDYPWCRV